MNTENTIHTQFIHTARKVITLEAHALTALLDRLDHAFTQACELLMQCDGRVIVMGMGKSGHIARKIAATLASTGTPAFFVHPAEAGHGDMGMITAKDIIIALSNSGETEEIIKLLPLIKRAGIPFISLSGNPDSTLAQRALLNINVQVEEEACALGLAPTASTTAALAMGDAIAIALLSAKGFNKEDFARSHPNGSLGKRLLLTVDSIMHTDDAVGKIGLEATIQQALLEMTRSRLGATAVVDENNQILGIFTDGDLRRALNNMMHLTCSIQPLMTKKPICIPPGLLAAEALRLMQEKKINHLLVQNHQEQLIGAINIHDLLRSGIL